MMPVSLGGLVTYVSSFLTVSHRSLSAANLNASNSYSAAQALNGWYNHSVGLWDGTGWWNSANCLTVLADWAILDSGGSNQLNISSIISNTYTQAQGNKPTAQKSITKEGLIHSLYVWPSAQKRAEHYPGFINDFYDDEGWWALAFIRSWDVTKDSRYLDMAQSIFADMSNGTDHVCGGGIWWSKNRDYKNAIANELYLAVAASLANRVTVANNYSAIAQSQWTWFNNSGMINSNNNINDGLTINSDGTCVNNGNTAWSYNQGVILGGLAELAKATNDTSYLDAATTIALAGIKLLSDPKTGVIHESCEPDNCGSDASQFKGIFMRNLQLLYQSAPHDAIMNTTLQNANSIWLNDKNIQNQFGLVWSGPQEAGGGPNASTHSSAMDAVVAALAVSK